MEAVLREPRPEKVAVVDEVRDRLTSSSAAIITEYRGLAVSEMETLRRALTAAGGEYKIYKNTLVRRAAEAAGLEVLDPHLVGPTAIAFVDGDVAAVAKVLREFARANPNLVVKASLVGADVLDARSTAALADLPTREVLLAQIAGALAAPMRQFASLLKALPQNLAYGISALLESRGGATVESASTEQAEPEPAAVDEAAPDPAHDASPDDSATLEARDPSESDEVPSEVADRDETARSDGADEATVDAGADEAAQPESSDAGDEASAADSPSA